MGYRDDFYTVANIVGYTGELNRSPTVYFRHGNETGRITQYHRDIGNVGRNTVRDDPNYVGRNVRYHDGSLRWRELWPAYSNVPHTSRNALQAYNSPEELALLSVAIYLYPQLKTKEHEIDPNYVEGESRVESLIDVFGG